MRLCSLFIKQGRSGGLAWKGGGHRTLIEQRREDYSLGVGTFGMIIVLCTALTVDVHPPKKPVLRKKLKFKIYINSYLTISHLTIITNHIPL